MKALIFDSGTLINLSMNGLLDLIEKLKKIFDGEFLITEAVKYEVIDRPKEIRKFELGALRILDLLERNIINKPGILKINEREIIDRTKIIIDKANHILQSRNKWITLVSEAEVSCLALSDILLEKGIENIIAIDERTTRILCEDPRQLEKMMSERLHQKIFLTDSYLNEFSRYKFIRSSELVYVAYKKDLISLKGKDVLEALLYATKFKGAAISFEEIEELKRL